MKQSLLALGLDFGTESVRALLVDLAGREVASAVASYRHGQITRHLPDTSRPLPPDFALQHPLDWIDASAAAVRQARARARVPGPSIISIGVDFTSCTMLPTRADGTPLCLDKSLARQPFAWPKLWKHHGAKSQTRRINELAARRKEKWLARYGGIIGLEWFFPKILETLENAPDIYAAAEVWLEAGDWYVWQLLGPEQCPAAQLPRSTCQAGYKAMWNAREGYPCRAFFAALDRRLGDVVEKRMPGRLLAPGTCAGRLGPAMARKLGLIPGIPISAAIIDAHAGVPGAGVAEDGTLVMVMGTSSCHMLNSRHQKLVPGVAGVVEGGILPGFFGYETGQAAVGDAFDWFRRFAGRDFAVLDREAAALAPGSGEVLGLDWMNGCRTPLMDGHLRGAFTGLSLGTTPGMMYRALLEASAFGLRWIVDVLREGGVPVHKFVATGGLPHHNPLLVQIYADVLGAPITIHPSRQGPALGAAILGVLAAGPEVTGFASMQAAMRALAAPKPRRPGGQALTIRPDRRTRQPYAAAYQRYRHLAHTLSQA